MSIHPKGKDKHGRPGWEVVIQYKRDGIAMRKAFVVRGTKAEAKTFEATKLAELAANVVVRLPNVAPKFSSFCADDYKASAKLHLKASTWTKRSSQLATLIEFFGEYKVTAIDDQLVDEFKRWRRDAGLKNVSINNELRVLRKVLLFARDERGIDLKPPRMRFLAEGDKRPKVWTADEVKRLFDACATTAPSLLPVLVFLVNTGARRGEALALQWSNVDLERLLIQIWPVEDDDEHDAWEPKNRRPREVPIGDRLLPWLNGARSSETWVFPASTGDRYAYWPENTFQRVQQLAKLSGGVHTLRHTYASHFLQAEPDLFLLAKILGHSHTRVTELYSHLLPNHLDRGRNAVAFAPDVGPAIVKARKRWRAAKVIANAAEPTKTAAEPANEATKPSAAPPRSRTDVR